MVLVMYFKSTELNYEFIIINVNYIRVLLLWAVKSLCEIVIIFLLFIVDIIFIY